MHRVVLEIFLKQSETRLSSPRFGAWVWVHGKSPWFLDKGLGEGRNGEQNYYGKDTACTKICPFKKNVFRCGKAWKDRVSLMASIGPFK